MRGNIMSPPMSNALRVPGVLTLLPEQFTWREVQPVGRLDHDTTGMLLISDDGPFIHAQSSPKRHVPKIYQATTQEPVTQALIDQLLAGVKLHDEPAPLAALTCIQRGEQGLKFIHGKNQCRMRPFDVPARLASSINIGMAASKRSPSSATQK